jgi:hypothetical protein
MHAWSGPPTYFALSLRFWPTLALSPPCGHSSASQFPVLQSVKNSSYKTLMQFTDDFCWHVTLAIPESKLAPV